MMYVRASSTPTVAFRRRRLLRYVRNLPNDNGSIPMRAHGRLTRKEWRQMPTTPQPPRKGHPGKPSSRDGDAGAKDATASKPHSYGQSAPMPGADEPPIDGETRAPARKIARVEERHESIEDLASEPMREAGEDEDPDGSDGDSNS
jgi:hypothetical protein